MAIYPAFKQSFFFRFLCITIFMGNIYMALEAFLHLVNFHGLDGVLRFYAFNAPGILYLPLLAGAMLTLTGARLLWKRGPRFYKVYVWGKCTVSLAYILLIMNDYSASGMPFPWILIPLLLLVEGIYPFILYVTTRQLEKKKLTSA